MELCDFIVTNDETELLIPQVLSLHEMLLKKVDDVNIVERVD
jgi:hypothetical protein